MASCSFLLSVFLKVIFETDNMPFSIVLTKEKEGQYISLVPVQWVTTTKGKSSFLCWPPEDISDMQVLKLRRNDASLPEAHWKKLKCEVKVTGISSLAEGIKLEKLYSKFDDTEDEERYFQNREAHRKNPTSKWVKDDSINMNADMERVNTAIESNNNNNQKTNNDDDVTKASDSAPDTLPDNNDIVLSLGNLNTILEENTALITENKNLKESVLQFQNLEQETKRGFAIMQIQLDKIFDLLNQKKQETVEAIDDTIIAQKKIEFPIKSIDELDLLEKELANADFAKALVEKFSNISGKSGTNKIGKIGLILSKSLFTDELLQCFTWKGIKGCAKPPFSKYINIRSCFYKIVHLADNSCTVSEADSFLQNSAIKHSGQRIKRKSCEVNIRICKKKKTVADKNAAINKADDPTINVPDKLQEVIDTIELDTTKENQNTYEAHEEFQENQNDNDDMPDPSNCFDESVVTVLSDVKIKDKIMQLKQNINLVNLSSDNLLNSKVFSE